jgi:hypothetical protein
MNISEEVKKLAAKEREVRNLEILIERVTSLSEAEFAKLLATLGARRPAESRSFRRPEAIAHHPSAQQPISMQVSSGALLRYFAYLLKT